MLLISFLQEEVAASPTYYLRRVDFVWITAGHKFCQNCDGDQPVLIHIPLKFSTRSRSCFPQLNDSIPYGKCAV